MLRLRRVVARRRPDVPLRLLLPRLRVPVELLARLVLAVVRRPPRRLLEFAPIPMDWPREDCRLRLADFIRLVAIA